MDGTAGVILGFGVLCPCASILTAATTGRAALAEVASSASGVQVERQRAWAIASHDLARQRKAWSVSGLR